MTMLVHISPFDPARTVFVADEAQLAVIQITYLSFKTRKYILRDVMQFILQSGSEHVTVVASQTVEVIFVLWFLSYKTVL